MFWIGVAGAALFEPGPAIGPTGEWSNKVILADLDGDTDLDIVFANGGDYASPGSLAPQRMFRNESGTFEPWALPGDPELSRSIQAGDVDGDGLTDLFVSAVYGRACRLYLGTSVGFTEASENLPDDLMSIGDVELGDIDGDGDLDAVLADWGSGNPLQGPGAPVRLWRNDGGVFTDDSAAIPDRPIGMSWDLELADVDGDFDLDVLVSSKTSDGSSLFLNDGTGQFTDGSGRLPAFTNNYEFAPMDVDDDGDLDLITVNDGNALREHVLINTGEGTFESGNGTVWPGPENAGEDDNVVVFADLDDDGDPDFVIGSLSGADRAILNEGTFVDAGSAFSGPSTPGTLGLALGDLDGDGRLDAVMAQGELASDDLVYRGVDIAVDSQPPVIVGVQQDDADVLARVHDRMTPIRPSDLRVFFVVDDGEVDLVHRGADLFSGTLPSSRQGNLACVPLLASDPFFDRSGDTGELVTQPACGCQSVSPVGAVWGVVLLLVPWRRRSS